MKHPTAMIFGQVELQKGNRQAGREDKAKTKTKTKTEDRGKTTTRQDKVIQLYKQDKIRKGKGSTRKAQDKARQAHDKTIIRKDKARQDKDQKRQDNHKTIQSQDSHNKLVVWGGGIPPIPITKTRHDKSRQDKTRQDNHKTRQ